MTSPSHPATPVGYPASLPARLLADIAADLRTHPPFVLAISGLQGSGKTTLADQLQRHAQAAGLTSCVLSVDDFYLDRPERAQLARQVHPLLATRGPPGTHDLALAAQTFASLRQGRRTRLPRFDKSSDQRQPESAWPWVSDVQLIIFEGWFLRTPAQHDEALLEPVNRLERDEDPDRVWRHYCNDALARDYPALWQQIQHLVLLQAPGFEVVRQWRWQQEQALHRQHGGGMDQQQVERFVQLFERVSRHALQTLPALAEVRIDLDMQRSIRA